MTSAVAGTFDVLHDGHRALISKAFEIGDKVLVGVTSDEMAGSSRGTIVPLENRIASLRRLLDSYGKPYSIAVINDIYGPAEMDDVDVLVVSEETLDNGRKINEGRESRGIEPLRLIVVSLVMSCLGTKISSREILEGEYGRTGRNDVPDIAVGSLNPVKVEAVRNVLEKILGDIRITAVDARSGVSEQPFGEQTREGAENRAKEALGEHDMAVGIEAGVFEFPDGLYDIQHCCVIDKSGRITYGQGPGFRYPDEVADKVRSGMTVGDAFKLLYGAESIGKKGGAIGMLSHGLLDRMTLTEQSVMAAMIPRIWEE